MYNSNDLMRNGVVLVNDDEVIDNNVNIITISIVYDYVNNEYLASYYFNSFISYIPYTFTKWKKFKT